MSLTASTLFPARTLGRMSYAHAYDMQLTVLDEVLAARAAREAARDGVGDGAGDGAGDAVRYGTEAAPSDHHLTGPHTQREHAHDVQSIPPAATRDVAASTIAGPLGVLLFVEHDPVITVSRRAGVANHLLASEQLLSEMGITLAETDRGGDITYHGPGQLVAYPIIDLNALNLGLHEYMRLLEESVIRTVQEFGVTGVRDAAATGVWVEPLHARSHEASTSDAQSSNPAPMGSNAKLCACGVRVRRWVSMHGLAINISTNLAHFDLIVPCGLHGRPVTSLQSLLRTACPSFDQVQTRLTFHLQTLLLASYEHAIQKRSAAARA